MDIYTRRHDEDVNYSIMLVVEFQPISLDEGENEHLSQLLHIQKATRNKK